MSLMDLGKLPVHNGIIDFKITKTSFLMLNVLNDDSSIIKYFWQDSHDLLSLDLWYELSINEGTFIDDIQATVQIHPQHAANQRDVHFRHNTYT